MDSYRDRINPTSRDSLEVAGVTLCRDLDTAKFSLVANRCILRPHEGGSTNAHVMSREMAADFSSYALWAIDRSSRRAEFRAIANAGAPERLRQLALLLIRALWRATAAF
jgi:hypothetical protein